MLLVVSINTATLVAEPESTCIADDDNDDDDQ